MPTISCWRVTARPLQVKRRVGRQHPQLDCNPILDSGIENEEKREQLERFEAIEEARRIKVSRRFDSTVLGVGSKIGLDDDIIIQTYIIHQVTTFLTELSCRYRLTRKTRKGESQSREEGSRLMRKSA